MRAWHKESAAKALTATIPVSETIHLIPELVPDALFAAPSSEYLSM